MPSEDALALSQQLKTAGKSQVRSIVQPIGDSQPVIGPPSVDPNLREVIVNGPSETGEICFAKICVFRLNE